MTFKTSDLCDAHAERVQVAEPLLRHYGARRTFSGQIVTLKVFEDRHLIREAVSSSGYQRVLVIDGGGSTRSALVGDRTAATALAHHWAGIVIHGALRDVEQLAALAIGVMALAATPLRSSKPGEGYRAVPVAFAGIVFRPGEWLYADADGLITCADKLA